MSDTHGERRKRDILAAGVQLWPDVTARSVARVLDITHSAILYHFGTVAALRDAVAVEAVRTADSRVVPMLITARHPAADVLSSDQRQGYLAGC